MLIGMRARTAGITDVCAHGRSENRARDVGAAARERRDLAVLRVAEEPRVDHDSLEVRERARERRIAVGVERRVAELALQHHAGVLRARVPRLPAARGERDGDELRVVVLAGGLDEIEELLGPEVLDLGDARAEIARDVRDDVLAELELVGDEGVALYDRTELAVEILAGESGLREVDQEVGDLCVPLVALARGGNHHDAPRGISEDNVNHLVELRSVREGTAAEFADFHRNSW